MSVHNHGPEEGPGLACIERLVDGKLRGDCLKPMSDPISPAADLPVEMCEICKRYPMGFGRGACNCQRLPVENSEFDIEAYIKGLKYGDGTDDHARTLVAGNLRRLYQVLVPSLPVENSKPTATDYACPDCHADRVLADRTDTKGICAECGWSGALQEDGELRGSLDEVFRSAQFAADIGTLLSHVGAQRAEISRLRTRISETASQMADATLSRKLGRRPDGFAP